MIVFCEECGQKNILPQNRLVEGKARFTCTGCGFKNAYMLTLNRQDRMHQLKEKLTVLLKSDPLILGFFVFQPPDEMILQHLPDPLTGKDVLTLARHLIQGYNLGSDQFKNIEELTLYIGDKMLTVFHNAELAAFLIIISKETALSDDLKTRVFRLLSFGSLKGHG